MKICILIESSGHELFVREADILKKSYKRIAEAKGYDVEIYSYKSTNNPDSITDIEENTIIVPGMYWQTGRALGHALDYIQNNTECDVIIKTNTSTIINLTNAFEFIHGRNFDMNTIYYPFAVIMDHRDQSPFGRIPGLCGCCFIFSSNVLESITERYWRIYEETNVWWKDYWRKGTEEDERLDIYDDWVVTYSVQDAGINTYCIDLVLPWDFTNFAEKDSQRDYHQYDEMDLKKWIIFKCKLQNRNVNLSYDDRLEVEVPMIQLVTKLIEHFQI